MRKQNQEGNVTNIDDVNVTRTETYEHCQLVKIRKNGEINYTIMGARSRLFVPDDSSAFGLVALHSAHLYWEISARECRVDEPN